MKAGTAAAAAAAAAANKRDPCDARDNGSDDDAHSTISRWQQRGRLAGHVGAPVVDEAALPLSGTGFEFAQKELAAS